MQRYARWFPLFLFLFALLVRVVAIQLTRLDGRTPFDGLYGQDSFAYYGYALALRQALLAGELPPPFFWPMGYPLVIGWMSLFLGSGPAAGQWVSVLAGAGLAPLVYQLVGAYRSFAWRGGVVAGLLTAVAGQLLLSSVLVMADGAVCAAVVGEVVGGGGGGDFFGYVDALGVWLVGAAVGDGGLVGVAAGGLGLVAYGVGGGNGRSDWFGAAGFAIGARLGAGYIVLYGRFAGV